MTPRWLVVSAVLAALLEAIGLVAQAGLIAWLLAVAAWAAPATDPWPALLALLAAFGLRGLAGFVRDRIAASASTQARRVLRDRVWQRITQAGPLVVQQADTGRLAATLLEGIDALDGYFARYLPQRFQALIVPLSIALAVTWMNWLAGLLLIITAPLILVFMVLIGMGAEQVSTRQQQAMARLGGHFLNRLQGVVTLRLFGALERSVAEIRSVTDAYRIRSMATLRIAFLSSAVLEFFSMAAIATVAIYVGFGLLGFIAWGPAATLTLFSGLFILLLTPEFFQPLRQLGQHYHDRATALGAAQEIRDVLDLPAARTCSSRADQGGDAAASEVPAIELDRVTVRYPDRPAALHELSLCIAAGEKVALVGSSGSGKSTLIHLLTGFIEPHSGTIRMFGNDLDTLDDSALNRLCVWVGQRPTLFHGTIADNIRMGRPDAGADALHQAARQAGVLEFAARLPAGLNAPVGERGSGFSGGQAQRIAVARALLSPAPILLLDEPTANLDPENERWVLSALDTLRNAHGRTVLCATHRTTGMAWADRIVALDGTTPP